MSRRLAALVAGVGDRGLRGRARRRRPRRQGHEKHVAQMSAAQKTPAVRVMSPQPAISDIMLVDQGGHATTLRQAVGTDKPVFVNFIFTTCTTICPVMSAGMSQFLKTLGAQGDKVRVISVSST